MALQKKTLTNLAAVFLCLYVTKYSPRSPERTEGVFLDVIGTKILRLLLRGNHSHQLILLSPPPPLVFLDLRFLHQQLKGGGTTLFTLSLCYLCKKHCSFSYYTLFIYKYIFSQEKLQLEMHQKEENLTKPYNPYGFRNLYKTIN
jgi:hypothetical protein